MGSVKSKCQTSVSAVFQSPYDVEEYSIQEIEERERGRAILRAMVNKDERLIDWEAVIQKAQELHIREQKRLKLKKRKQRRNFVKFYSSTERRRRRKADAAGSFGINLATIDRTTEADDQDMNQSISSKHSVVTEKIRNSGHQNIFSTSSSSSSSSSKLRKSKQHPNDNIPPLAPITALSQFSSPSKIQYQRMADDIIKPLNSPGNSFSTVSTGSNSSNREYHEDDSQDNIFNRSWDEGVTAVFEPEYDDDI